jgi:serine/threonine protein kinase
MANPSQPVTRVGKYTLLARIATGGMGQVYKARDEVLGRIVALKVLSAEMTRNPVLVERFRREAKHAARLSHKNIVTLFEADQDNGTYYLAMEYVDGLDLSEYIKRKGQLDPDEARRIVIQACKALDHAYSQGITHRDIKPSNFLLANEEGRCRVKLTDLGLARTVNEEDFRVTRDGTTVGTVDYMSPEQARDSAAADVRSDIYSLGCTFYHMLAGQPPFAEGGLGERVYKHLAADPVDVRHHNPKVSAGLSTVLRRMLAKHPDDRFQTPAEVIQALKSISEASSSRPSSSDLAPAASAVPVPAAPPVRPSGSEPEGPLPCPPRQRERRTTASDASLPDVTPDLPGVSPEQRQAAAGQFERAFQLVAEGGHGEYAQQLLLSACKLDPNNLIYRKTLRDTVRCGAEPKRSGGWFGSLTNLPARGRLKAARRAGDHRKVLEYGEELLTRAPEDVGAQVEMAESAAALGLAGLAVWLLEQALRQDPPGFAVHRTLAQLYEKQRRFNDAIALWEEVRKADPADAEALQKINALAVSDTLARGKYWR